jgi:V/A-type H+-transporting ATPase subunit E
VAGLERILQEIRAEAAAEAAAQQRVAQDNADKILTAAKAESDAVVAQIEQDGKKAVAEGERSRSSAILLQRRQKTLQTKQVLLAETLQKAREALTALQDKEYFDLLVRLAAKNAAPGSGEMLLNERDAKRLPAGFEKQLAEALPKGSSIAVSDKTCLIDGGVVLQYGDIEVNCSFAAIFDAQEDEMADNIAKVLFAD